VSYVPVDTYGGSFKLTSHRGQTVTEKDLIGKPHALFFGFTHCPDVCPTTLQESTIALNALGKDADKIDIYFVTIDPERDTQALLKTYLEAFHPKITALTGSREEMDKIVKNYGIYAKKSNIQSPTNYTYDHSTSTFLFDKKRRLVSTLDYHEKTEIYTDKLRLLGRRN
jgi:protein SCO1/2